MELRGRDGNGHHAGSVAEFSVSLKLFILCSVPINTVNFVTK